MLEKAEGKKRKELRTFKLMREAEIRNIRLITKLKEDGISPEKIKE